MVFHADGRLAEGPIALVEVQGYVYAAKSFAASCARALGMMERAIALDTQAEHLRHRFDEAFWCEDIGTYALALDGEKTPCKVRTSNAGQTLFTGIAEPDRAHRIANDLFGPSFYSGWGIRTVAKGEARYNPMSYHNGSIWPHDNALIAQGLARYGHKTGINLIFEALMRTATYMDQRRLPELFAAFVAGRGAGQRSIRPHVPRRLGRAEHRFYCFKQCWGSRSITLDAELSSSIPLCPLLWAIL